MELNTTTKETEMSATSMESPSQTTRRRERPGRGYRRLCSYATEGFTCSRWAAKGWTTCDSHHTAGRSLAQVRRTSLLRGADMNTTKETEMSFFPQTDYVNPPDDTPIPQRHDCEVKRTFPDHVHAAYQVVCDICGNVGQLQPREADAGAIAVRHFEQGGFERRGA